ncbi:hypothetical protein PseudUWO311_00575 [Pseudanabaena sp. UWO311]|uniref:hypothetical protein n=1 Tax=Pseudanabaena sp. UWO311 TaxID=2487337 RepID=UPI001158DE74|nr:hypothetical protein [Pseudanabaena sp. UWO311]TYQ29425.1 hypothetical protein PseudUWO311_00575 [Pseudanabaena sp. UWO311]
MPPFVIEASLAIGILISTVRVTSAINEIKQAQEVGKTEVLGKIAVIHTELAALKEDNKDIKSEIKQNRKFRVSDHFES